MRRLAFAFAAVLLAAPAFAGDNEDALIAADTAFNAMAQKDGVAAAFAAYAAPDARMFRGEETPVSGPAEIEALMAEQYTAGGSLTWAPTEAVSSADGTLGFTHGRWTYTSPKGEDGAVRKLLGSYVSIWAKQPDGTYKFAVDIGNPDRPKDPQD
jgi:ketosteroid isomerase-like protein